MMVEPQHDTAIVQGATWSYVKTSVYGTIVVNLFKEACEAEFEPLGAAEKNMPTRLPRHTSTPLWRPPDTPHGFWRR